MRKDEVYAQIQMKKLWMFLAQINYNAATGQTTLGNVRDLCTEAIERLTGLVEEIDKYQSDYEYNHVLTVEKPIKAKVGKPVRV